MAVAGAEKHVFCFLSALNVLFVKLVDMYMVTNTHNKHVSTWYIDLKKSR